MRTSPTILHVDLDAFFAAVEQRDRPELRGRPVIVGGDPGARGVVSAASYEARAFGVHSALPLRTAAARCPDGVFLPVDGAKYRRESRRVMEILGRFTPLLEQVSIDEAFLDVAGSEALFGPPEAIARRIKAAVREEVGLTASVGVATTKLVAKVASDLRKPDGLVVVPPGGEAAFLAPLPITRLWGVGEQTRAALADHGVRSIGDLAALPVDVLVRRLGSHGATLHERALGIDPSPVTPEVAAKSVSHEHTFDVDTADPEVIERTLLALSEGVAARLRAGHVRASTVAVKVRDSAFHTVSRQRTLPEPTDLADPIYRTALELARPEIRGRRIRLLGVGAHGLGEPAQLGLFAMDDPRRRAAVEAQDAIRRKYGSRALTRARLVGDALAEPGGRDPMQPLVRRRVGRVDEGPHEAPHDGRPVPPPERRPPERPGGGADDGNREKAIVAAGYDAIVDDFADWSARVVDPVRDRLFEELLEMLPAGAAVLDVGCGSGVPWTRELAARFEVTGIDISQRQVAAARRNVPGATFVEGDVVTAAFAPQSFHGAIALYSIGHLPREEHRTVLERIAGWLRPGGLLLAALPAAESAGWTGAWLRTSMFFASLGTDAYRSLLRDLGYETVRFVEATAIEPDGPARFLWVLVRAASASTTGRSRSSAPRPRSRT